MRSLAALLKDAISIGAENDLCQSCEPDPGLQAAGADQAQPSSAWRSASLQMSSAILVAQLESCCMMLFTEQPSKVNETDIQGREIHKCPHSNI